VAGAFEIVLALRWPILWLQANTETQFFKET
jgi:hypothetical protein